MNLDVKGSIATISFKKECYQLRKEIIERVNLQLDWNHVRLGIDKVIATGCKRKFYNPSYLLLGTPVLFVRFW